MNVKLRIQNQLSQMDSLVTSLNIYYSNPGCSLQERSSMFCFPCQHCHIWCKSDIQWKFISLACMVCQHLTRLQECSAQYCKGLPYPL